jgi:hydroxymethylglutaryl-CoA reductase (NADPH)
MQVPGFLLRRLYVKGSLRNANGGFEFDLKNTLGSGNAEQVLPLTLDSEALPVNATNFIVDGVATPFDQVSAANPMTLGMNKTLTIACSGRVLSPGKHKLGIGFVVPGMGRLEFDVTDAIEGTEEAGDVH